MLNFQSIVTTCKKKTVAVVVATVCNVLYVDGLQYYF